MNPSLSFLSDKSRIQEQLGSAWGDYGYDLENLLHLRWLGFAPATIFDIGSRNASWSAMAHQVFSQTRFELFEPLWEVADSYALGRNEHPAIARFLDSANCRIHSFALGARNGKVYISHRQNAVLSTAWPVGGVGGAHRMDISVRRLDDAIAALGLPSPDLIKVDTSGSEMEVLVGAGETLAKASVVFLTCWLTKSAGPDVPLMLGVANRLKEAGFDLFAVGHGRRDERGIAQTKDAVFVKRGLDIVSAHPPACEMAKPPATP